MNRDELRLAIRQRADMVGSQFVTDSELDLMIDASVADLYDLLTTQYGDEYWSTVTWIQIYPEHDPNVAWPHAFAATNSGVTNTNQSPDGGYDSCFTLPDDFVRLVRCQFHVGTALRGERVRTGTSELDWNYPENWILNVTDKRGYPMHRIDTAGQVVDMQPQEWTQTRVGYRLRRGTGKALRGPFTFDGGNPVYRYEYHNGTIIEFLPVPIGTYAVQVTYVPGPSLLPNHPFPDYLVFDCAALCLEKQRSDSSVLRGLQERVKNRISQYSRTPDAANAPKVVDVYGGNRIGHSGRWLYP